MGNSENPKGGLSEKKCFVNILAKEPDCREGIINNLTALKFFLIATAQKNLCLASYSFYLFLERKELIEVPFILDE